MWSLVSILLLLGATAQEDEPLSEILNPYIFRLNLMPSNGTPNYMYSKCKVTPRLQWNKVQCWFWMTRMNDTKRRCNVKLVAPKINDNDNRESYYFGVTHLESMKNTAVLVWCVWRSDAPIADIWRDQHRWVSLVDMDNCANVNLDFSLDDGERTSNFHVLVYNDGFHVSLNSRTNCSENHNPCVLRYNHKGRQIGENGPFPSKYYEVGYAMPVDRLDSSSGGFFTTFEYIHDDVNSESTSVLINASHVSYNGSEAILFEHHYVRDVTMTQFLMQSNDHGYYSFCHPDDWWNMTIRCVQYDAIGRKMMNTTVELEWGSLVLGVFNLRRGGVVVVSLNCDHYLHHCENVRVKIKVVSGDGCRVTGDGASCEVRSTELLRLLNSSSPMMDEVRISHVETDEQHCFFFAYVRLLDEETKYKEDSYDIKRFKECISTDKTAGIHI